MPLPVFDLGVELWKLAHPWLGAVSQQSPPTACQLMMYYAAFNPSVVTLGPAGMQEHDVHAQPLRARTGCQGCERCGGDG